MFGSIKPAAKLQSSFDGRILRYKLPPEKNIDFDAQRFFSGSRGFCAGAVLREGNSFFYQIDTAGMTPIGQIQLTIPQTKGFLEALAYVMGYISSSNGSFDNLVLAPDRIYLSAAGYSFVYVPVKRKSDRKKAKIDSDVKGLLNRLVQNNRLFYDFLNASFPGDNIIADLSAFAQWIVLPAAAKTAQSGPISSPQTPAPAADDDEGETTLFSAPTVADDDEGETTLFSAPTVEDDDEGETTLFSAPTVADDDEGETTLFGAPTVEDDDEGETTLFGAPTVHGDGSAGAAPAAGAPGHFAGPGINLIRVISGEVIPIPPEGTVIGSAQTQGHTLIPNRSISRSHAQIIIENGAVFIKDLGSTNGTAVDGIPLTAGDRAQVFDGSFVTFGSESLHISIK